MPLQLMRSGSYRLFLSALPLAVFILSGCASTMSVGEAKKVSVSMSDSAYLAPPRKIDDILLMLEKKKTNSLILREMIMLADQQPPDTMKDPGKFYRERGTAALLLGRLEQASTDMREALDKGPKLLNDFVRDRAFSYFMIARIEYSLGNYGASFKTIRGLLDESTFLSPIATPGIGPRVAAAQLSAMMGDYDGALYSINAAVAFDERWHDRLAYLPAWIFSDMYATEFMLKREWTQAELYFRLAIEQVLKTDYEPKRKAVMLVLRRLYLANTLAQQGKLIEAESVAREALFGMLEASGTDNYHTVMALQFIAENYLMQGRFNDAMVIAERALGILHTLGAEENSPGVLAAYQVKGKALLLSGDGTSAAEYFSKIIAQLRRPGGVALAGIKDDLNIGIALIRINEPAEAEALFRRRFEALVKRFDVTHYDALEARALIGVAASVQGRQSEALRIFREVMPSIMESPESGDRTKLTERTFRLRFIINAYIDLLFEGVTTSDLSDDRMTEIFRITEAARAGAVQKAIVEQTLRNIGGSSKELGEIIRQYQDIQVQTQIADDQLSAYLWTSQDTNLDEMIGKLRTRIRTLEEAGDTLLREIKSRVPSYDRMVNPTLITADEVRKMLRPGEVLVSSYPTDRATYIWAVPREGSVRITRSALTEGDLSGMVTSLRRALDSNPRTFGDIPEFDLKAAYALYEQLLKPHEQLLAGAREVIFVSHGSLGQLPIHLLLTSPYDDGVDAGLLFSRYRLAPWLIRKHALSISPSLDALRKIRSLPLAGEGRRTYAGFGDPLFKAYQAGRGTGAAIATRGLVIRGVRATGDDAERDAKTYSAQLSQLSRLPDTAQEIETVARVLGADPARDVFLRERASEGLVKSMNLADLKVLAFATHALIPGDLDGLDQPALALSAPAVTGEAEDGLLTMKEVLGLKLNADWVILSACNTGAGEDAGKEAISGLGRAFFFAGTRALLVSYWPVESNSAMRLVSRMFRFYREERLSRSEALRRSMLDLVDNGILKDRDKNSDTVSYAHPLFWAPFAVVGDGSGTFE